MASAKPGSCASRPDYDRLAGKPGPAARLLRCIDEHARRLSVPKDGLAWCPLPRHLALRETGLSLDQYHRALRRLRGLRLVSDRMAYFKAVRMPHFALLGPLGAPAVQGTHQPGGHELSVHSIAFQGGETATMEGPPVQSTAFQGGETPTTSRGGAPLAARAGLASKKESKKEKKVSKTSVHSHATVEEDNVKQDFGKAQAKTIMGKQGKTVAEVLSEAQSKPQSAAVPGKASSLEPVWRDAYALAFACFVPSLTVKERAQLKHFAKQCPGNAPPVAVLRFVVAHWAVFVGAAAADAGAYSLPGKPSVGFLAKHLGVAVNLWLEEQKLVAMKAAQSKPAPLPVPVVPKAPAAVAKPSASEGKATLDEVLAILSQ